MFNLVKTKMLLKNTFNAIIYLVPVCLNTKAFLTKEKEDNLAWIQYWIVFSLLFALEILLDFHKSCFPCYDYFKIFLLCCCIVSIEINLSTNNSNGNHTQKNNPDTNANDVLEKTSNELNKSNEEPRDDLEKNNESQFSDVSNVENSDNLVSNEENGSVTLPLYQNFLPSIYNESLKSWKGHQRENFQSNNFTLSDFKIEKLLSTKNRAIYMLHLINFNDKESILLRLIVNDVLFFMKNLL